jgi:hypothetical protein
MSIILRGALLAGACLLHFPASAETLYKCVDAASAVTYQDSPCEEVEAQRFDFPHNLNVVPGIPSVSVASPVAPPAAVAPPQPPPQTMPYSLTPPDVHQNIFEYAAWSYARERLFRDLRNCRIMNTCPTPLDRLLIMQAYGFATDSQVNACRHYPGQCRAW